MISLCIPLFAYNFFNFLIHFDINKWFVIFTAAGKLFNIFNGNKTSDLKAKKNINLKSDRNPVS